MPRSIARSRASVSPPCPGSGRSLVAVRSRSWSAGRSAGTAGCGRSRSSLAGLGGERLHVPLEASTPGRPVGCAGAARGRACRGRRPRTRRAGRPGPGIRLPGRSRERPRAAASTTGRTSTRAEGPALVRAVAPHLVLPDRHRRLQRVDAEAGRLERLRSVRLDTTTTTDDSPRSSLPSGAQHDPPGHRPAPAQLVDDAPSLATTCSS